MQQLVGNMNSAVEQGLEGAIGGMAAALGTALAESTNVADAVGAALLGAVGAMAVQLGQLAISTGITMAAIQKAFANPYTAIAAGIALVAVGAAVSSKAKAITSGSGGGGAASGGGGNMQTNFQPNLNPNNFSPVSSMIQVGGVLKGSDIILSVQNSNRNRNRVV